MIVTNFQPGSILRGERERQGLTPADVADQSALSVGMVHLAEVDDPDCEMHVLATYAEVLGLTLTLDIDRVPTDAQIAHRAYALGRVAGPAEDVQVIRANPTEGWVEVKVKGTPFPFRVTLAQVSTA